MRGHLQKRGDNTWRLAVYLGRDADGKRRYQRETFHGGKRAAEDRLAQLVIEAGRGSHDVTNATFADLANRWLTVSRAGLSPSTVHEYDRLLSNVILPRIGPTKLRTLRAANLDAFYSELLAKPLSPVSVQHVHALIRRILNQGVRWGWLPTNPAANATPPKVSRRQVTPPDPDSVLLAINRAPPDLAVFLRLATVTGARRGELCALRWSDVDLLGGSLTIAHAVVGDRNDSLVIRQTKTGTRRTIALDKGTVDALGTYRNLCDERAAKAGTQIADDGFIFSQDIAHRTPARPGQFSLAVNRFTNSLGLRNVTIQNLRHGVATQLLAAGVPLRTVAGRLGHSQPSTTMDVYAAWLPESDRQAAEKIAELLDEEGG